MPSCPVSQKSELALVIGYALSRRPALTSYRDEGHLGIDNNIAERDWLFPGSDDGGYFAAAIYSLISTANINGLNPEAYLRHSWSGSPITLPTTPTSCYLMTCSRKCRPL